MKKIFSPAFMFLSGLVVGIGAFLLMAFSDRNAEEPKEKMNPGHNRTAPPLPSQISFAGEQVPIQRWEIREQLDREVLYNYYSEGNILYMLKLSNRYFPMIQEQLKANGIPDDFKYLCIAESNLSNAISRVGATGFWQFMKGTAPAYGMEINSGIDERYNVMKSTNAACEYLKQAYAKFGSWTAAAASYNCGMGGYNSAATYQGSRNYYDLLLPEETQRYIFRILAFKYLLENADSLGFKLSKEERYQPVSTRTITVTSSISNLATFARENGTNYKMLRWLNPWIRSKSLHVGKGKQYEILLPGS
jgi:membrane-bound lytic murein transglycosylase D